MDSKSLIIRIMTIIDDQFKREKLYNLHNTGSIYSFQITEDAFGYVGFNIAKHRTDRRIGITPIVGVRYLPIETMISDLIDSVNAVFAPTICTPLGYVSPEQRYSEWLFEDAPFDYKSECLKMFRAIQVSGFPFMTSHSTLDALIDDIERLRFILKENAIYKLPIAYLLADKKDAAAAYVEECVLQFENRVDNAARKYKAFAITFLGKLNSEMS